MILAKAFAGIITNMMIPGETMCFSGEHDSIFDVSVHKMNYVSHMT